MAGSNTADNAQLEYEGGQTSYPNAALSDSGDHINFNSQASYWSGVASHIPVVTPDGLATGGLVTPNAANDAVDATALTCYIAGLLVSVGALANIAVTRGTVTNPFRVSSITVDSAGALAVVAGVVGSALSMTRGAAGGAPLVPVGSVEIAQVQLTSNIAAPVASSEIFAVVGQHVERFDYPLYNINYELGSVTFLTALPTIHVGNTTKAVFASYAAPIFTPISLSSDFVPPENSHSVSSKQVYGTTMGSTSSTLNQGSFISYSQDNVTDPLIALKNQNLWFRFYPNKYKTPHILTQGILGVSRTFPSGASMQAACTISSSVAATEAPV